MGSIRYATEVEGGVHGPAGTRYRGEVVYRDARKERAAAQGTALERNYLLAVLAGVTERHSLESQGYDRQRPRSRVVAVTARAVVVEAVHDDRRLCPEPVIRDRQATVRVLPRQLPRLLVNRAEEGFPSRVEGSEGRSKDQHRQSHGPVRRALTKGTLTV